MNVKKCRGSGLFCALFLMLFLFWCASTVYAADGRPKNVILFVADGMGSAHTTIARWYKGSALHLDSMYVGGMRTYGADSLITDSAPAATAFACGQKSNYKMIGIMPYRATVPGVPEPGRLAYKPIASVLEGAKLSGMSTGLIATSNIQHATPAAFSSHWPDRNDFQEIAKQQVYQNIDVVFGGGRRFLLPGPKGGVRKDGEDLIDVLASKGYAIVTDRKDMMDSQSERLWGLFADLDMAYELDRREFFNGEPSLAEMTRKAIEALSKGNGFFLVVEGSKIDWASHAHDPVGIVGDILAFDDAVGAALDFARKNGNTVVISVSDHGTGGMSLGSSTSDKIYSRMQYEDLVSVLKKARCTGEGIEKALKDRSNENIKYIVQKYLGIDDLTDKEINDLKKAKTGDMIAVTGPIISTRSHIGWTTPGHTGEDLFFYYWGIEHPMRILENSDVAHILAKEMNFDLADVDRQLFVDAGEAFKNVGASTALDKSIPGKIELIVEKYGKKAQFTISTNIMTMNTGQVKIHQLNGIAVFAPATGKVYIPREAVNIFEEAMQR